MKPSNPLKLNSFTCLAFLINRVIDAGPGTDLSYQEIFDAASERRLIPLLADRYGQNNAFTFVTQAGNNLEHNHASLPRRSEAKAGRFTFHASRLTHPSTTPILHCSSTPSLHASHLCTKN